MVDFENRPSPAEAKMAADVRGIASAGKGRKLEKAAICRPASPEYQQTLDRRDVGRVPSREDPD
jgi:hypothetical protein